MPGWDRFLCVDWAKDVAKRRAWVAEIGMKRVGPLEVEPTLAELLTFARALPGRSVIGIDAALGVPRRYLEEARRAVPEWSAASDFLTWVVLAMQRPSVLREARSAAEWRPDRPFIAVPAGKGTLEAFWAKCGGKLMREIDLATLAKSPFVVSGIPGTVGSGSRALWIELAGALASDLAIWPFDGALQTIGKKLALAEIYPRVCYSLALADELPAPMMSLAKTSRAVREGAVDRLMAASWVRDHGVMLRELELARDGEDDFDAMISAAAMMRCALEGRALEGSQQGTERDPIEGGILGLTSVQLAPRP